MKLEKRSHARTSQISGEGRGQVLAVSWGNRERAFSHVLMHVAKLYYTRLRAMLSG